jgi:hypothetical protein
MPDEGHRQNRLQPKPQFLCGDNFMAFAAPGKGRSRAARRVKRIRFWKRLTYSHDLFLS